MARQIRLEVITPDRVVLSTEADVVVCPGVEGQFGVLVDHVPFLSALEIGEMYYRLGNKIEYLAVSGGFAEVTGSKVTVVAESAELGHQYRSGAGPPGQGASREAPGHRPNRKH